MQCVQVARVVDAELVENRRICKREFRQAAMGTQVLRVKFCSSRVNKSASNTHLDFFCSYIHLFVLFFFFFTFFFILSLFLLLSTPLSYTLPHSLSIYHSILLSKPIFLKNTFSLSKKNKRPNKSFFFCSTIYKVMKSVSLNFCKKKKKISHS